MSVSEVAQSLVEMCRAGKFQEAYDTLFAPNAHSVEGTGESADGLEAIKAKGEAFDAENEIRDTKINGPFVGTDSFAVHFAFEISRRSSGETVTLEEVGVYTVGSDGKITKEEFLYKS